MMGGLVHPARRCHPQRRILMSASGRSARSMSPLRTMADRRLASAASKTALASSLILIDCDAVIESLRSVLLQQDAQLGGAPSGPLGLDSSVAHASICEGNASRAENSAS